MSGLDPGLLTPFGRAFGPMFRPVFRPISVTSVHGVEIALPGVVTTSEAKGRMSAIDHSCGDCVGNWRLLGLGEDRMIQCDACNARYPATPENRLAAIDENYAGIYLRRLSSEGAALGGRKE